MYTFNVHCKHFFKGHYINIEDCLLHSCREKWLNILNTGLRGLLVVFISPELVLMNLTWRDMIRTDTVYLYEQTDCLCCI